MKLVQNFLTDLSKHRKEVSQSRLSDSNPFTKITKKIKSWYDTIEHKIKENEKYLTDIVNNYINLKIQEKF